MADETKQYTVEEFAASIKEKYPQYEDVDDNVLVDKMLEKYPVYQDKVVKKKEQTEVVGENGSQVGVSEEAELTSTSKETPEGFRTVAEKGKGLIEPIEKEVVTEKFIVDEPESIAIQEEQRAERKQRTEERLAKVEAIMPEIDNKISEIDQEWKDLLTQKQEVIKGGYEEEEMEAINQQIQDKVKNIRYLEDAKDILEKSKRYAETSDAGFFEALTKGDLAKDFFTLGVSELARDIDIHKAAKKMDAGEQLSEAEETALHAYGLSQALQSEVEPELKSMLGNGLRGTVGFMVNMAGTSPAGAAAKSAAKKGVQKVIKGSVKKGLGKYTQKVAGELAESTARTALTPGFYGEGVKGQVGEVTPYEVKGATEKGDEIKYRAYIDPETQKTALASFGKSFASTASTYMIETVGGRKLDALMGKVVKRAEKLPPAGRNIMVQKGVDFMDAAGVNNVLTENIEEFLETYKEGALEGEYNPLKMYTMNEFLSQTILTSFMSGSAVALRSMYPRSEEGKQQRLVAVNSLKDAEAQLKPETVLEVDRILQGDDHKKNSEQLNMYLKKKGIEGATPNDLSKVINYAAQKSRMDFATDMEQDILEEQARDLKGEMRREKAEVKEEARKEKELPKEAVTQPKTEIEVEPKIKQDEVKSKSTDIREADYDEVRQERRESKEARKGEEVLARPTTLREADSNIKILEKEKASLQETFEGVPEDQKQKIQGEIRDVDKQITQQQDYAEEIRTEAQERGPEERVERKEGRPVRVRDTKKERVEAKPPEVKVEKEVKIPIKREAVEQRASEARTRIGDVTIKKPTQLVKQAKSVAELDYLKDVYGEQIPEAAYKEKLDRLKKKNLLEDTEKRVSDIASQVMETKAKDVDVSMEEKLGKDKYAELKAKRSAEVDKLVNSLGNLANIARAVGDGKKLDTGRELVQVAKSLANLGMINVELGTRQAMDRIKEFVEKHAPNQLKNIYDHENLIARELGTREYDKKLAEAGVKDVVKKAAAKTQARKDTEEKVGEKRKKPFKDTMQRMFVDQSNPFKIALLKEGGPLAQRAVDYFNTQSGMSGRSMSEFESARKKILGSFRDIMNPNEQNALQEYLNYKRVIELDKLYDKRGQNRLKHEGDVTMEEAEVMLDALMKNDPDMLAAHDMTQPVDWKKIEKRAQNYWDTLQNKLTDMYEEGVISKEVYNKLKKEQPHYTPRRYLENFIETVDPGGSISGVEALSGGSTGSILTDTQTLLADAISRANNAIARNRTMKSLRDVAEDNPNDVVKSGVYKQTRTEEGVKKLGYFDKLKKEEDRIAKLREKLKKEGRPQAEIDAYIEAEQRYIEPEFESAPKGYTTYKFKDDGRTQAIYINNDYTEDFVGEPDAEWMRKLKNVLSWVSGNKILKAFATGYNPEFAIKNLPLDMMHILTTTEAYSPVYPVATAQLSKDIAKVAKDAWQRKGRYKDFVEEGGSMEYLATQGSLSPKKFKNYNRLNLGVKALLDGASHIQNTSEIMTRLALRERMIDNYTKDFEKNNGRQPTKDEKKEIQQRATAYARNYLDFAQGGKAIKFMNSVVPYLNAGFQVTRGSLRAAQRNPKVFWSKMAQLGATATALTAYNLGMFQSDDDEEAQERKQYYLNDISDRRKADNFIIMTPINYEKNGKKHYVYFAFPKDNAQKTIAGWFEGATAAATGEKGQLLNQQRWMELQSLVQNVTDLGNLPPVQSAIMGSKLNKDLYWQTDIWSGRDMGKYKSEEYTPGLTPQRFIKAGEWSEQVSEALGLEGSLSPARLQYFTSQFTTKSNVIGTMIGEALDATVGGLDKETEQLINKSVGEQLVTQPFSRRFFKKTSPYTKKSHAKEEMQKINAERQKNDNKLKPLLRAEKYSEAMEFIADQEDPMEMQRLLTKFTDEFKKIQGVDYRIRELGFVAPKARARAFHKMWVEADSIGRRKLLEGSAMLGYFNNAEFTNEIMQLMNADAEFTFEIPE